MDELEARIAALELLALERLALDGPGHRAQLRAAIAAGLDGGDADERMVRRAALQLLDDADRRFDAFTQGGAVRRP